MNKFASIILATTVLLGGVSIHPVTSEASTSQCTSATKRVQHATSDIKTFTSAIERIEKSTSEKEKNGLPIKYENLKDAEDRLKTSQEDMLKYCPQPDDGLLDKAGDALSDVSESISNAIGDVKDFVGADEPKGYDVGEKEPEKEEEENPFDLSGIAKDTGEYAKDLSDNVDDEEEQHNIIKDFWEDKVIPIITGGLTKGDRGSVGVDDEWGY